MLFMLDNNDRCQHLSNILYFYWKVYGFLDRKIYAYGKIISKRHATIITILEAWCHGGLGVFLDIM